MSPSVFGQRASSQTCPPLSEKQLRLLSFFHGSPAEAVDPPAVSSCHVRRCDRSPAAGGRCFFATRRAGRWSAECSDYAGRSGCASGERREARRRVVEPKPLNPTPAAANTSDQRYAANTRGSGPAALAARPPRPVRGRPILSLDLRSARRVAGVPGPPGRRCRRTMRWHPSRWPGVRYRPGPV